MKMKKGTGFLTLILTVVVILALCWSNTKGFGATASGAAKNIILGLDLAGGVSITYQVADEDATADEIKDTIYKLQKRVEGYSTEASVYQQGDDRINIEIPGVSDANTILEDLGKPGSLLFITQTDAQGNITFQSDAEAESGYSLTCTMDDLMTNGALVLEGNEVEDAQGGTQNDNIGNVEDVVKLAMTPEGTEKFATATSENVGKQIAIVWDGEVISAPRVQTAILDGSAVITGMKDAQEAENLASSIRIGGLSVKLEELSSNVVGASLGGKAISTSLIAGLIGLILVIILMIVLYRVPGIAASLALLVYTGLTLALINAFNLTLTLPGIAGVILAIGMAVDANVIIFARVQEELAAGKSVSLALKLGFEKALSAILDGNITTLIAAIVLDLKGSGSVKGFAQTLALGIVLSMFTALVITRLIINALYALGVRDPKFYGKAKDRKRLHVVEKRKYWFIGSSAIILIGIVVMIINGASADRDALNLSLEFKGGTSTTCEFAEELTIEDLEADVVPFIEDAIGTTCQVQTVPGSNEVVFKSNTLPLEKRQAMEEVLTGQFGVDEKTIETTNISATTSGEMRKDAVIAVIIAVICMLIYIWFRFSDIRFAGAAVIALAHDVLITLTAYAVLRVSVGTTFIACMLTIVGYSINATIVIFDRIREKLKTSAASADLAELVNDSVTSTMTRTIYTSLTTFIMVAALFVLGVTSVREFALPLMIGIAFGAYSSACITGSLWFIFKKGGKKKKAAR